MLSICVIVFTVCIAVQIIFYGVSLLNIGLTVSLLIMYIGHYKEQYNLHMNNCIYEAIKDTQSILSYRPAKDSYSGQIQETKDEILLHHCKENTEVLNQKYSEVENLVNTMSDYVFFISSRISSINTGSPLLPYLRSKINLVLICTYDSAS